MFDKINLFDMVFGLENCPPLVRLFAEAFVKYQSHGYTESFEELFKTICENDEKTQKLFEKMCEERPVSESRLRFKIRIILLILDNEICHQLITILTGIDGRIVIICANVICNDFPKIILNISECDEIDAGYIGLLLYEEIINIKSCIEKYF